MGDPIRLSLWFDTHRRAQMLPRLLQAVTALPAEAVERGANRWAVRAVDWSEPPLLEACADGGVAPAEAMEQMAPFAQDDCACTLEMTWLIWEYGAHEWRQHPRPVIFSSLGPEFGAGTAAEAGELEVDLGLDEPFLAQLAPWNAGTRTHLAANIVQLLAFSHQLQGQLQPRRRRLWSDLEADWSEKLMLRLHAAAPAGAQS